MDPRTRMVSLILVYATLFADVLGISIIVPVLPFYAIKFGATGSTVGILFSSYAGAQFLSTLIMGRASDRVGRRPLLLLSLFGSTVGSFASGMAWSLESLIAFRVCQGLLGGSYSIVQAYIADVTTPDERPRYLAIVGAVFAFAFLFGPGIGAGLSQFGLRVPLFVAAGVALIGFVFAIFFLKEPAKNEDSDEVVNLLSSDESEDLEEEDAEHWDQHDDQQQGLAPTTIAVLVASFLHNLGFFVFTSTGALLFDAEFNLKALELGFVFSGMGVISIVIQAGLFQPVSRVIGYHIIAVAGSLLMCVGFLLMALMKDLAGVLAGSGVMAIGTFFTKPCISTLLSLSTTQHRQGQVLGYSSTLDALAGVVAPLCYGFIFEEDRRLPFFIASGVVVLSGVAFLVSIMLRTPEPPTPEVLQKMRTDPVRPATRAEKRAAANLLFEVLEKHSYKRWYAFPTEFHRLVIQAFPPLGEDAEARSHAISELTAIRKREELHWRELHPNLQFLVHS